MNINQLVVKVKAITKQWLNKPSYMEGLNNDVPLVKLTFEPQQSTISSYFDCYALTPSKQLWESVNGQWNFIKTVS